MSFNSPSPAMAPSVRSPAMAPSVRSPAMAPTVSGPIMAPSVRSPAMAPTVSGPIMAPSVRGPTMAPTAVYISNSTLTSVSDPLTMEQLNTLIDKIDFEILALRRLPPTTELQATISRLAIMRQDLVDFKVKLTASPPEMKLSDTGITQQAAENFLASLGKASATSTYPTLLNNTGFSSSPSGNASMLGSLTGLLDNQEIQKLFQNIQFIKWKFEVDYDPKLHEKFFLLDRLENLEKRILSYSSAGTPVPSEVRELAKKELEYINLQIQTSTKPVNAPAPSMQIGQSSRTPTHTSSDPRVYNVSTDVYQRPGFLMSDEQIRNRASASYFYDSQVGTPDYKKRVDFLCSQIQSAGLGDPTNFGCITNPASVSKDYSWKGNWDMVCSRLGDTWGAWYPEMFGCPKPNPDDKYDGTLL